MARIIETLAVKVIGDVDDFESKMSSLPGMVDRVTGALEGATDKISSTMKAWGSSIKQVGDSIKSFGDGMTDFGMKWSMAVTAPLVALGKHALTAAADYEKTMNTIESVTGAARIEMAALSHQALQLGKDTVFSAGEAAQAQLELAKAGMEVSDVLRAMPGVLDLAAAGEVDLAYAAKLTASTLNAFGLEAEESTRIADLLAAAANASAADIGDLSLGLQQSGFAFAASNQTVEDLVASLAILTNVGLKGSDAGTALKNAFMQLLGPTKKSKELMDELGISVFDASGNMKPLREIIDIFNTQLGSLSQQERLAALDTIFLSDGMKAMIPILDAGTDGFDAMKEAVTQQGAAQEVAQAKMKGLAGAIEYFKGTLDSLMIETSLPWLEQLSQMVRGAADLIAKFGELDSAVQRNVVIFLAIAAAVGPVLIYVGMLFTGIGSIVSAFGSLVTMGGTVLAWFGSFLGALGLPVALLAALVVAIVGFAVAWANSWFDIQNKTTVAINYIKELFWQLIAYIQTNWPAWKAQLLEWGNAAWQWIVDAIPVVLAKIGELITSLVNWVMQHLPDFIAAWMRWSTGIVQWIGDSVPAMLDAIAGWVEALLAWLSGEGEGKLRAQASKFATALLEWIGKDLVPKVGPELQKYGVALADALGKIAIALAETVGRITIAIGKAFVQGIINGIQSSWSWLVSTAQSLATAALNAAKSALGISSPSQVAAEQIGMPFAQGIMQGARAGLGALSADIASSLNSAVSGITPSLSVAGAGGGGGGSPISITINVSGGGGQNVANDVRGGVLQALRQVGLA